MSEQTAETTEAASPDGSTDERLSHVEAAVDRIEATLSKLVPGSHEEAEEQTERRLGRGSAIEDQVRAELQKARQEETEAAAREKEKADQETVKERLARLEETPPAPPRLRRTVLLGWGDGRK